MVEHPNIVGGLIGGLLIGFASLLLLVTTGRIAGISGIVGGAVRGPDRGWRVNFVAGLLLAGGIGFQLLQGVELRMQASGAWLVAAGLLVGLGTRIGSGCTSGHGVCGLGRRSPRSLVATGVFMGVGVLTVLVTRHVLEVL
ncbi:MAG: YeeE/YedE family protein [Abyssibacter sp.]|uniref:YeeE/YedE family protein n=1 Tax=Abyssibacter sp. TaxID=2320200 RepID=UPI00321B0277